MAHLKPVLAGNWKMNQGPTAVNAYLDAFLAAHAARTDRTVIMFPPALTLATVRSRLKERPDIRVGVQNVHTEEKGAFTGENSALIAADAGAHFVLVGHSERRHVFGETDVESAKKCAKVVEHGMVPVLCVGETIEQREHGDTEQVVLHQLRTGLSMLDHEAVRGVIVAYEPVWAIGTGRTATPDDASTVHRVIRAALVELVGDGARDIPILYGGSVTATNVKALLAADEVDGVLVGGACLDPASWATICGA
ncbi:MAG: Triosephosphate isomerase, bacterial/eukaryotic [Gemmatimonadetes bacterium]|nr:Triosephosphate isomerase, bacterial/eukaryotic [Gemmatimonadota bacterium]